MLPLDFIRQNAQIFARAGSVVAGYRNRGAVRYGPYYRVAYRVAGRQCSIYLGRCRKLADRARRLLARLQQPRNHRRLCRKADRQRRAAFRQVIRGWQATIRSFGLDLRGCEIRGWRALGIPRFDKTTPLNALQKAAAALLRRPLPALDIGKTPFLLTNTAQPWAAETGYWLRNILQPYGTAHTTGCGACHPLSTAPPHA
ncbi:MAG: hypothetical protein GXX96_31945 [Planctomycetaceae bacterium]|jgi:hypothetical protein|nr:hypothetical protein [Planctomycetaceae bacterium]